MTRSQAGARRAALFGVGLSVLGAAAIVGAPPAASEDFRTIGVSVALTPAADLRRERPRSRPAAPAPRQTARRARPAGSRVSAPPRPPIPAGPAAAGPAEPPASVMKAAALRHSAPPDATEPAATAVDVIIDVSDQLLTLAIDGSYEAQWAVSTGKKVHWTPTGEFSPTFLSKNHRSSRYDDAPMPYAVFFNGNIALHGTTQIKRLGRRASHGCVRLHPDNARTLFNLVRKVGKRNVRITVAD